MSDVATGAPASVGAPEPLGMAEFVRELVAAADRYGERDLEGMRAAVAEPIRRLVGRQDLLSLGLPRPGNNVDESWYLYYDGELSAVLFKVPAGPPVQPHDHGLWETLLVYRGALQHTLYERADDGRVPGRAVLRERESRILQPGDFAVVAPPRDIHGFHAVTDGTYGITVSRGLYNPKRLYFDVQAQTCATRRPRTLR
jgi:predicted metal-dependent enzyme (double-stranded beta helix superfamily)